LILASYTQALPPETTRLNRFPQMLQEYYVGRVRQIESAGLARKSGLKNRADAIAYQLDIRARIRDCFGPLPERTPLRARIMGTVERESYRIEKVLFKSRPGLMVTGNLYLPKGRGERLPGVIATCGHSNNGKAIDTYQSFTQGLAKLGYVVFIHRPDRSG
jgi:dipeptidyl aminopeptidase/acylaminoacyl peptidase